MIEDVHVQLALFSETAKGEIAAAQITDDRVDRVGTKEQVELRVKRMTQEQLYTTLL